MLVKIQSIIVSNLIDANTEQKSIKEERNQLEKKSMRKSMGKNRLEHQQRVIFEQN